MSSEKERKNKAKKNEGEIKTPLVYTPPGAKLNSGHGASKPPSTRYEKRKAVFTRESIRKLIGRKSDATADKKDRCKKWCVAGIPK